MGTVYCLNESLFLEWRNLEVCQESIRSPFTVEVDLFNEWCVLSDIGDCTINRTKLRKGFFWGGAQKEIYRPKTYQVPSYFLFSGTLPSNHSKYCCLELLPVLKRNHALNLQATNLQCCLKIYLQTMVISLFFNCVRFSRASTAP